MSTILTSCNPATGEKLWQGEAASGGAVAIAVEAARRAFPAWSGLRFEQRKAYVERFRAQVEENKIQLAEAIAQETGKVLWDATGEVTAVINKIAISINAYGERTGRKTSMSGGITQSLQHRPHGVMAVFGPYNFPAHLPNGHIVPALLAGNTVIFKPSEETPMVAELYAEFWRESGLPGGVLNLVQGAKETGIALASAEIDGLLFTGSYDTGRILHKQFGGRPEIMLALEMGGNNPLIAWDVADKDAAALLIIQSAFITTGQRCTCARRLIVPSGKEGDAILDALLQWVRKIRIGAYTDRPEPFMGPLINLKQAESLLSAQASLLASGAKPLKELQKTDKNRSFLSPGILDVTNAKDRQDKEFFGPLLQVIRADSFDAAIIEANTTKFGLAAGLISDQQALWEQFHSQIRAGIVNWNRQTTGAASTAPFGGIGYSGNHRPSAYYAADYTAWPMAGMQAETVKNETPVGIGV